MIKFEKSIILHVKMTETPNYHIALIDHKETHLVRHPVLRQGRPLEDCIFDGDELATTLHFGLFINQNLVAVASFMENPHSLINEKKQYQLRGMAVLKEYQGIGLGHNILKHAETILRTKDATVIWCNAREIAVHFYKKNQFEIIGKPFLIPNIGLHFIMKKTL